MIEIIGCITQQHDPALVGISFLLCASAILIVALGLMGARVNNHIEGRATLAAGRLRTCVQELEATKAALENSNRNLEVAFDAADAADYAKSKFIAVMSHELRTPLNAVLGFSQLMLQESSGALGHPDYRGYVENIFTSGTHLLALVNNVLDLKKINEGAMELAEDECNLLVVMSDVVLSVMPAANLAHIRMVADTGTLLPMLRADRLRLRQILMNLVENAIKFTPRGGSVQIRARRQDNGLAILVSDTGMGIAPESISKILNRFGQLDTSLARCHEGIGLGLPLAKLLTELHGGRLEISSEEGVGTTVTVIFPTHRLILEHQAA